MIVTPPSSTDTAYARTDPVCVLRTRLPVSVTTIPTPFTAPSITVASSPRHNRADGRQSQDNRHRRRGIVNESPLTPRRIAGCCVVPVLRVGYLKRLPPVAAVERHEDQPEHVERCEERRDHPDGPQHHVPA